jgi:3',5'-cyclic-AMP phosphodiesterase
MIHPIDRTASTRRHFLQTAVAGLVTGVHVAAAERSSASTADETGEVVAILNDTHIGEEHGPNHAHPANLQAAVAWLLALPQRPARVIINGDLAFKVGTPGDYRKFIPLIAPLRAAGLAVHLTLGNHDNREEFLRAFPGERSASRLKEHRHNTIVDLAHVRLLLLDSLKDTPAAPGRLGAEQIAWLLQEVDARPEKPVVLVAHHNPTVGGDPVHYPGGLEDTAAVWPELVKRSQVKAYLHGHIHDWSLAMHSGIHIVNTLATSVVGNKAVSTTGWTMARFLPTGLDLTIHTHAPGHPWSAERKWLFWRPAKKA